MVCLIITAARCHGIGVEHVECDDQSMRRSPGQVDYPVTILQRQPWETAGGKVVGHANAGALHLSLSRFEKEKDRAYCSFVAVDTSNKVIGFPHYVQTIGGAVPSPASYPIASTKKGLQVSDIYDALSLGIKHAALNVVLGAYIDLKGAKTSIPFQTQGRTFYFHRDAVESLDRQIKLLSDHGVLVTLIMYSPEWGDPALNKLLQHPHYDPKAPNHITAFNVTNQDSTEQLEAFFEFMAQRYSQSDQRYGRAVNFIVGNEVDSQWEWYNMGQVDLHLILPNNTHAVRLCHTAVRKFSATDRVFISLDHFWNMHYTESEAGHTFAGRKLVELLHKDIAEQGDIDWNIAFHPYPEDLFNPKFWNDKTATHDPGTGRITFKNIEMLPKFLRQPEMLFDGKPRHIILSEQGFHTTTKPDGEIIQAAAFAYAWVRVNREPGIDAFIYYRQADNPHEGGLNLGLWWSPQSNPHGHTMQKKKIYDVFKAADTDHWRDAFQFALPIIGVQDWQAAP